MGAAHDSRGEALRCRSHHNPTFPHDVGSQTTALVCARGEREDRVRGERFVLKSSRRPVGFCCAPSQGGWNHVSPRQVLNYGLLLAAQHVQAKSLLSRHFPRGLTTHSPATPCVSFPSNCVTCSRFARCKHGLGLVKCCELQGILRSN